MCRNSSVNFQNELAITSSKIAASTAKNDRFHFFWKVIVFSNLFTSLTNIMHSGFQNLEHMLLSDIETLHLPSQLSYLVPLQFHNVNCIQF